MRKRLITTTFTLFLASVMATVQLMAQTVTVNVTQAGGLWDALIAQGIKDTEFSTVKNLTITGTMGDTDFLLIKNLMSQLETVDISGIDVKEIPDELFRSKEFLTTVRLPEGVTQIGYNVFSECQKLAYVTFGSQTAVAGKIVFPESLRNIGSSSFNRCKLLTHLDLSACSQLEYIQNDAFHNLYNLTEVLLPSTGNLRLEWACFNVDSYWDESTQKEVWKGLQQLTLTKAVTWMSGYVFPRTLRTLKVESATPPSCNDNTFNEMLNGETTNLKVYVPKGSKRNYAVYTGWSKLYSYMEEQGFKISISGYGSVKMGNATYADGDVCMPDQGGDVTLKAIPDVGCTLTSVSVDGKAVTVAADGTFTISGSTAVSTVSVVFTSKPLVIENPDGGALKEKIAALGTNVRNIRGLKVVGKLTTKDWAYIKNSLTSMEELDISETDVKTVPQELFRDNQKIKSVHLSSTVATIESNAFNNCQQLTTLNGCENITEIGNDAFNNCTKLANFPFGNKINSIESSAFYNCTSLPETLVMPASLTKLGWNRVFDGSSIQSFDLSQCAITNGFAKNTFGKCTSLILPENGDYYLGYEALKEAQLKELRLPAALYSLSDNEVLPSILERLYVSRTTPINTSNNTFNNIDVDNCILYVPVGSADAYSVASNWSSFTKVQELGFMIRISGYGSVKQGNISYTDGSICMPSVGSALTLSAIADAGCELISVKLDGQAVSVGAGGTFTIPTTTTTGTITVEFTSNQTVVNNPNGGELKDMIAALGTSARNIRGLKVVGKLTTKDWAYIKNSLTAMEELDISETDVKTVPQEIFRDNQKIKSVHLSSTVATIESYAFNNCQQLTTLDGCENIKEIGNDAFNNCTKLANFPFGDKIKSIESSAFFNCSSLPETLVMPASLTSIGWSFVFYESSVLNFDLSQCTLSGGIGQNTFGKCTSLILPENGDYYLGYEALKEAQLKELRLPEALRSISDNEVLPSILERLYVSCATPISVSNNTFNNIDVDNCTLYVPIGSLDAYEEASGWFGFTNKKEYGMQVVVGEHGKVKAGSQTLMGTSNFYPTETDVTFEILPHVGWHAEAVTLDGADIAFANNKFTLSGNQLKGKLKIDFAVNQFNLQLQIAGSGKVKLGSIEYTAASQTLAVDSLAKLSFTLEPAAGKTVTDITFNGKESVVQNGGINYVTPAITSNATLSITFGTSGAGGNTATYTVTTGEGGTVEFKNTSLLPQTTILVKKNEDAVFSIKPDDYYVIEKVLYNDTDVTEQVGADGLFTVSNVSADATLQVTFEINSHVVIALEDGVRLKNALTEEQKQYATKLTVSGQLWEEDFFTMRDQMPLLEEIDLSGANTEWIPYRAFCTSDDWDNLVGKTTLVSVRLPECVKGINSFAFAGCTNLKDVNLTDLTNLESIGSRAFGWTSLNVIDLTKTKITEIGDQFYKVKGLENMRLPLTITSMGELFRESNITEMDLSAYTNLQKIDNTFYGCKKLVKVVLPEGLLAINSAFYECDSLRTVNLPKSLQTIGGYSAFRNTKIQKLDLSQHTQLITIGNQAFYSCKELREVVLPSSLQQLGDNVFSNCEKLQSVDLSKTQLEDIPSSTFSSCNQLESIKLPAGLVTIGSYAFAWCEKLAGVLELPATVVSIGERAFDGTQISIIKTAATTPPTLSENTMSNKWVAAFVPEGYADVYKSAPVWEDRVILDKEVHAEVTVSFEGNLANDIVEQAQIAPAQITHLKVHGPLGVKDFAIMRSNMTLLYDLDMEDAECSIIPENAFLDKKVLMNVKLPRELLMIQEYAFKGCSSLKGTLTLPAGVTTIGWAAFQGCGTLEKVEFSEALEVIRGYAFEGCSSLQQEITFPERFTSLGEYAFANCRSLQGTIKFNKEFYMFMGSDGYWSSTGCSFENCNHIEVVDMSECEYLYQLPRGVFRNCSELQTVKLPPYLERIESFGFAENSSLQQIEFPQSLMYIDDYAFSNNSSIKSVNLSGCENFATIGYYAFADCASLEAVNLPASLNWINSYAFSGCRRLGELNVEALQPADLGDYVFRHVHTERCVLSIPTGTYSDYLSAPQWGEFVSMRKAIDINLDEGATLTYSSGGDDVAAPGMNRAPSVDAQEGNVNVKDGSSLYVAENDKVTFYINPEENVSIKQVLYNGEDVTGQLQGKAFVTPSLTDNTSFKVLLNVDGPITVKELRMLETAANIRVAESKKIEAVVYPTNATNKKVTWSSADENVARVAADGTVTGVAAGRTTITARTEDGGLEQTCEIVVMSNDYYITLKEEVDAFVDNVVDVPLMLHNAEVAQGIQFDVYMSEGLGMDKNWAGVFSVKLSGRAQGHTVSAANRADGSVRVVIYSQNGQPFTQNDGQLLTLPITTQNAAGDYEVEVRNIHISGPNSFNFSAPDFKSTIHVADYPMGDSNGNGSVTISDVTNTVDEILEKKPQRFILKAADVNADGLITVADVTATVDVILERPASQYAGLRAQTTAVSSDKVYIDNFKVGKGQKQQTDLKLTNTGLYTAFQCDILLPEGLTVASNDQQKPVVTIGSANSQSHLLQADYISSGALRLVVMSMDNKPFAADGAVVNITFEANETAEGERTIDIQNVRLVDVSNRSESTAPSTQTNVHIVDPSGIKQIDALNGLQIRVEGHDLVVIAQSDCELRLTSLDGKYHLLQVKAGEQRFTIHQAGVYVVAGRKIVIK